MAFLDDVLTQENFANQVDVVAQERSQRMDNVPYGTVFERALPLIFDADHPYGHLPIGNMEHLAAATLDEVSAFHAAYYMPNNAVLSIVGDVDVRRTASPRLRPTSSASSPVTRRSGRSHRHCRRSTEPRRSTTVRTCRRRRSGSPYRLPVDAPDSRELAAVEPGQRASSVRARRAASPAPGAPGSDRAVRRPRSQHA